MRQLNGRARLLACACAVTGLAATAPRATAAVQDTTRADSTRRQAPITLRGLTVIGTARELLELREQIARIPGSVVLVEARELARTRQANLPDVLRFTPGVWVQPRFGAADESQLSIRGSGLRNNFHLRGVNILINGMAYRNADGFTDFESLELLTAENIQVYKGGNALRWGGSTLGGAINVETRTGYSAPRFTGYSQGGSWGFVKAQAATGGVRGPVDWYASYARTSLEGYRAWSGQSRDRLNLHAGWVVSPGVDVRAFYLFADVDEQLPGNLTRAEFAADPRQAAASNASQRWGRDYDLHHLGVQVRTQLGARQRLDVAPYFQHRDINHPIFQTIAQISRDYGVEARYENTAPLGTRPNRLTVGTQWSLGNIANRRYQNDVSQPAQRGALTKDQRDEAGTLALYVENVVGFARRVSLVLGARYDRSVRESEDGFLTDGDQSDRRVFQAVMPKVGVLVDVAERAQLFANVSRSYEPPILAELNSLAVPGFVALRGQDAWQFEVGSRGRRGALGWDVAAFDTEVENEISNISVQPFPGAPFTVPTYRNIPRSRHFGVEAALSARGGQALEGRVAYTWARHRYVRDSAYGRNEIPGVPRHAVQAEVRWMPLLGLSVAPSLEWVPEGYPVNSANSESNEGWAAVGLRAEYLVARASLSVFAAVANLFDERYSPAVNVDDASGRFFQPADGRSAYAGLRWTP